MYDTTQHEYANGVPRVIGGNMLEHLRVDDRLLHGQVAFSWTKSLGVNLIVIANDEASCDQVAKAAFALAKPAGTSLVVSTVAKTAAFLRSPKADRSQDPATKERGCARYGT